MYNSNHMLNRFAMAAAAALTMLVLCTMPGVGQQAPAKGQFPAYRAPRMADGHPDLNGIWQALVTANWDLQDHEASPARVSI